MKLYDASAPKPMAVRLFILERGDLTLTTETVDIMTLQNRRPAYCAINPRGELPALQLDDSTGTVLTETTAICEYLDEVATSGPSLFGDSPAQRAETRMWLRRMDLEICQPVIAWFRNDPAMVNFYRGHRLPTPEARVNQKVLINQALNLLDEQLVGKTWLCGERFSAADVHFYGWERLDGREAGQKALQVFPAEVFV
ncbi:hypothetical protein BDW74DRAFT_150248 [Aspergillus multicolor]|uniref:glutathione S-transferase family protein n=1 Tax=Aspergillus multicolor TaxID=41759 RepID=UPI003CCE2FBF